MGGFRVCGCVPLMLEDFFVNEPDHFGELEMDFQ